jgi:hypothetical protein
VQGIVSSSTGLPLVQFRQLRDDGTVDAEWQADVADAREMAQQVVEAAMNATYDAAMVAFAKEAWPDDWQQMAGGLLTMVRRFRADTWGLPDQPDDWREGGRPEGGA